MPKSEKKIQITPFKFSKEARSELEKRKSERGISFIDAVETALLGNEKFNPVIESEIAAFQKERDCSRLAAIEGMLIEALRMRASYFARQAAVETVRNNSEKHSASNDTR